MATEKLEVYDLKRRINGLQSSLGTFIGTPFRELLSFLASFRDLLNVTGAPEGASMRLVAYYVDFKSLDVHQNKLYTAENDPEK